jgi:hypothetical protein
MHLCVSWILTPKHMQNQAQPSTCIIPKNNIVIYQIYHVKTSSPVINFFSTAESHKFLSLVESII